MQIAEHPITFSREWTKSLEVPWLNVFKVPGEHVTSIQALNRTGLDMIGQDCFNTEISLYGGFDGSIFASCLEQRLAISLADALSHVQDTISTYLVLRADPLNKYKYLKEGEVAFQDLYTPKSFLLAKDLRTLMFGWESFQNKTTLAHFRGADKFVELAFQMKAYGYGSGFYNSVLTYFGIAAILLHAVFTIIYIFWLFWKGDYQDGGWDTIGGLVSMAMRTGTADETREAREASEADQPASKRWRVLRKKWNARVVVRGISLRETDTDNEHLLSRNNQDKRDVLVLRRVYERQGAEGRNADLEMDAKERSSQRLL